MSKAKTVHNVKRDRFSPHTTDTMIQVKPLSVMKYLIICFMMLLFACNRNKVQEIDCSDKEQFLQLIFKSKYFLESYSEFSDSKGPIYIVKDRVDQDFCEFASVYNPIIKYTDSFNVQRNYLEQAKDGRFLMSLPKYEKLGDSIQVTIQMHNFYSELEYHLLKINGVWNIVRENESQQ